MDKKNTGEGEQIDPIMRILSAVQKSVEKIRSIVDDMNRDIGVIQGAMKALEKQGQKYGESIKEIREDQLSCPARAGFAGMNARMKRVEKEQSAFRKFSTGTPIHPADIPTAVTVVSQGNGDQAWKKALIKLLPLLIVAFAIGAGALAIVFFGFMKFNLL